MSNKYSKIHLRLYNLCLHTSFQKVILVFCIVKHYSSLPLFYLNFRILCYTAHFICK